MITLIFSMLQLLESNAGGEKATEFIQFTDNWLAKLQNSLTALQEEGEETLKQVKFIFLTLHC
jgi:hypothetical protein